MIAKLKTRLKREIKQHSVPRLGLHDDSSFMDIHKDGEITGRLNLAKELLEIMESEVSVKELRIAKKVLLSLISDSYDTLRNCPEARQDPSNIHATVKELKGAIDEIDRHINMEDDGADT